MRTSRSSPSFLACLKELIPRSERARLMDLVKFRGVVEGSLRSVRSQYQVESFDPGIDIFRLQNVRRKEMK